MSRYSKSAITPEIKSWIGIIALIMKAYPGAKTKKDLAKELAIIFTLSHQEMNIKIISAIQAGLKLGQFRAVTRGSWDLAEK